jgi:hypothetical protein
MPNRTAAIVKKSPGGQRESTDAENLNSPVLSNHHSSRPLSSSRPAKAAASAAGRPHEPRPRTAPIPAPITGIVSIDEFVELLCLTAPAPVSLSDNLSRHKQRRE